MDDKIVEQILDELFLSFENAETQSGALLLLLKDRGIVSDEKLAPFLEQAGNTSNVRWRAARLRMGSLIASALKSVEPAEEEKIPPPQQKNPETIPDGEGEKTAGQTVEQKSKSENPKKSAKTDNAEEKPVEAPPKNHDQDEHADANQSG